jgi:hypothetical protein
MYTTEAIIDKHELWFDTGDVLNGSLYVSTSDSDTRNHVISMFRKAGFWSDVPESQVLTTQKAAYKAELIYVAAAEYHVIEQKLLLTRFNHPKYPSSAERWLSWLNACDATFVRILND